MATNDASTGIARDLNVAIDDLNSSLERASAAAATIRSLVPRIGAIGSVLDELESLIHSGRAQIGAPPVAPSTAVYSRPTLVVPGVQAEQAPAPAQDWSPEPSRDIEPAASPIERHIEDATDIWVSPPEEVTETPQGESLTCFRLEFESRPGPLDLRTVDDAVSEHPAVRDVALLDYDGRKATLKVWITGAASPADVQQSLTDRASTLFESGNDVTIIALEDVA